MDDLGPSLQFATPKVRELTVRDLHDLAKKFRGEHPGNPKVTALDYSDVQSLEMVFDGHRHQGLVRAAGPEGLPGPTPIQPDDWSVSCCCCTPCCCCAAAEVDPFIA